jgi:hypothetical protein
MEYPDKCLSPSQEKNLVKAANAVARTEFETPDRTGCLDEGTLALLARRDNRVPDTPDLIDHIGTCSHCFIQYSVGRQAYKRRARNRLVLAAAFVLLLFSALPMHVRLEQWIRAMENLARSLNGGEPVREVTLDLRLKETLRGAGTDADGQGPTPRLPRANLSINVQLPVGSEDGVYDVAITNPAGQLLVESRAEATRQNFIEVMPVKMNFSEFPPGPCELRLRRAASQVWSSFSVVLE